MIGKTHLSDAIDERKNDEEKNNISELRKFFDSDAEHSQP